MDTPDQALRALRAPDQRNVGRAAGGMGALATDRLAALDAHAHTIRSWSPQLIPGLLQTSRYAAGAIRAWTPSLPAEEVELRVERREARAAAFRARWSDGGQRADVAWFLIGESAIKHPMLNAHAHADQLRHLLQVERDHPRVMVQVLQDFMPTPGSAGPFSLHGMPLGPRVAHLETLVGGWYTTRSEDVSRLYAAFSDMIGQALTPADTREFIAEEISCWSGSSTESSSGSPATATPTTVSTSRALPPAPSK